jgi:hypothetical protein
MQERDDLRELKQQKYDKNQNSLPAPEGGKRRCENRKDKSFGYRKSD